MPYLFAVFGIENDTKLEWTKNLEFVQSSCPLNYLQLANVI